MDPCKPCVDKYGIHDLNSVNNCCFQNCARESGKINVWDIVPTECGQKCMACLNKAKEATGRSACYLRRIGPPPIFVERFTNYKPYEQDHPFIFYTSMILGIIILGFIIFIVVRIIFGDGRR